MSARQVTSNPGSLFASPAPTNTPNGPNAAPHSASNAPVVTRTTFGGGVWSNGFAAGGQAANPKGSNKSTTPTQPTSQNCTELPSSSLRRNLSIAPNFGDTSFTVLVGPEEEAKRFSLHKSLAVNESGFFESTFRNDWKESSENVIRLPDRDPEAFEMFFLFIYTRRIYSRQANDLFGNDGPSEWYRLAHAWTLSAYLQATDFQDAIADAVLEKASLKSASLHDIHKIIYANSIIGTPVRKLFVDLAVWKWDVVSLEAQSNGLSWSDFFRDLSIALLKTRGSTEEARVVKYSCDYHEHRLRGTICYRAKRHGFS